MLSVCAHWSKNKLWSSWGKDDTIHYTTINLFLDLRSDEYINVRKKGTFPLTDWLTDWLIEWLIDWFIE